MKDSERALEGLSRLAIFPLPDAVLLPHERVPLHIFEPRYRAMTRHCLEGKEGLALAQLRPQTKRQRDLVEVPRVLPIIGVGFICESEALEDGRFQHRRAGGGAGEDRRGADQRCALLRVVRAVLMSDVDSESQQARDARDELDGLLLALCRARPGKGVEALLLEHASHAEGAGDLADRIGGAILDSPRERCRRSSRSSRCQKRLVLRRLPRGPPRCSRR